MSKCSCGGLFRLDSYHDMIWDLKTATPYRCDNCGQIGWDKDE